MWWNPKGKKRPVLRGPMGRMTPVPWVGNGGPYQGTWAYIDPDRAEEATLAKLCIICGEHRGDDWVYALLHGRPSDNNDWFFGTGPSPTYGHPECILKAVLYCPHLKDQEYPAMLNDRKTKLTTEDLKEIVKAKKILKNKPEAFASGSANIRKPKPITGDGRKAKVTTP